MSAFADGAAHLALKGDPDPFFRHAAGYRLQAGILHHHRRSDDQYCIICIEGVEIDLLDECGDQPGTPTGLFVLVQRISGLETFLPARQIFCKDDAFFIFETGDQPHAAGETRVCRTVIEQAAHRR